MKSEKSIVFISCYLGKLPWYFEYFIHSCKFNLSVNFIIITDDTTHTKDIPSNVKIIYKTLDEINVLASKRLKLPIKILHPYKLCDFKPTYGLLFPDLIKGYDFWGYIDIDIILGDIRKFITAVILDNYDIISIRHDFLTGYFQLFKNNNTMVNLFRHSKDYERVFTSEEHFCFDETNFAFSMFTLGRSYLDIHTEIESMTHVVRKLESQNLIKPYFDFHVIEGVPGKIKWVDGKLFYKDVFEAILYHLIILKKFYEPKEKDKQIPTAFKISASKIYSKKFNY